MKILALFFLFGFAAAISHEALEQARDDAILSFMHGMEKAPSLHEVLDIDFAEVEEAENEIKSELVKKLKEALDTLLKGIKEAVDHGKVVSQDMRDHLRLILDEFKKLHVKIGDKAKELFERIIEKTKSKFREWLEKLGIVTPEGSEAYQIAFSETPFRDFLTRLRESLEEKVVDLKKIRDKIIEKFGEKSMMAKILLKDLKEGTIQKFKDILDEFLNRKDTRAIKDLSEKIKEYIKEVENSFKHKFSSFLDWLEKVYNSGMEAAKNRIENIKKIAHKFLEHVKETGKKTAHEALEFFRPYKKDLGTLWDELEKSVKEAYGEH